ncbi:MAG: LPP20 family lipoprotein [Fusobacteriaceae bacterium]
MKNFKKIIISAIVLLGVIAMVSCSSAPSDGSFAGKAPAWYLKQPKDSNVYGVGSAKNANLDTARTIATNAARTNLSFKINAAVRGVQSTSSTENSATFNQAVEQITKTTLNGTEEVESEYTDGTFFVMISYPRAKLDEALRAASKTAPELGNIQAIHDQLDKVTN